MTIARGNDAKRSANSDDRDVPGARASTAGTLASADGGRVGARSRWQPTRSASQTQVDRIGPVLPRRGGTGAGHSGATIT
jgi:hypothetical protein